MEKMHSAVYFEPVNFAVDELNDTTSESSDHVGTVCPSYI